MYFLATKLAALRDRGWSDLRASQDLEDIVQLVDNQLKLSTALAHAEGTVRTSVHQQLQELLAHPASDEALSWTLPYGADYIYQETVHWRLRELAHER